MFPLCPVLVAVSVPLNSKSQVCTESVLGEVPAHIASLRAFGLSNRVVMHKTNISTVLRGHQKYGEFNKKR